MKSRLVILFVAILTIALTGCGGGNPMAGKWKLEVTEAGKKQMGLANVEGAAEFKKDNSFEMTTKVMGTDMTSKGTYKLEANTLTLTITEANGVKSDKSTPGTTTLSEDKKSFDMPNSNGMAKMVKQ
jgi:Lipocalin-like domain